MASTQNDFVPTHSTVPVQSGNITIPTSSVKLEGPNYLVWKARILPYLRATELLPFVDGSLVQPMKFTTTTDDEGSIIQVSNPEYLEWLKRDQTALGLLLNTCSDAIVSQLTKQETSSDVWRALAAEFAAQSSARASSLRLRLQAITKGHRSVSEFLQEINSLVDELGGVGEVISDNEYLTHLFRGLGAPYAPLATAISVHTRTSGLTREDLRGLLLTQEAQLELAEQSRSSPVAFSMAQNPPARPRVVVQTHTRTQIQRRTAPTGDAPSFPPPTGGRFQTDGNNRRRPRCQICRRTGHWATTCRARYTQPNQNAGPTHQALSLAQSVPNGSYGAPSAPTSEAHSEVDWYPDSGATNHVTPEPMGLDQLLPYQGENEVTIGDGMGLPITHTASHYGPDSTTRST